MLKSLKNGVNRTKVDSLEKLTWWFENPYTIQQRNTVNNMLKKKNPK
jgi:hypothetical protein